MIVCEQVERRFPGATGEVVALAGVSTEIKRGEFVVIKGPSGCGKTTFLLALGGMQRPTAGRVNFEGRDLYALSAPARNRLRAERVGFVFQLFHLVPYLTVRENILAGLPTGSDAAAAATRVETLLRQLGLDERAAARPATLSAGERQRTALARALVKQPALILADEPTGNLDPANAAEVFRHLAAFHQSGGTVVVVTHGTDAAAHTTRTLNLVAGRLVDSDRTLNSPMANPVQTIPST